MNLTEVKQNKWLVDWRWVLQTSKFRPHTFCECGVGPLEIAALPQVIDLCDNFMGFEPNPELHEIATTKYPTAIIHKCAVSEKRNQQLLFLNGGSSYLQSQWSPTPISAGKGTIVDVRVFVDFDHGNIGAMQLDCEGQEWSVLSCMISRPRFLCIEIWKSNPHYDKVFEWLERNRYEPIFSTGPEGETMLLEKDQGVAEVTN